MPRLIPAILFYFYLLQMSERLKSDRYLYSYFRVCINPFDASCSKLLLFEGFIAMLV